jgi:NAD(P)-dependent dehydrogenase (short-subunit alcohol dehydrogenase family)
MKRIFITGCSSGIGEAAAKRLATAGYRVFATVRRSEDAEALEKTVGPSLRSLVMDITDDESVRAAVAKARAEGAIDVLINNAGVPCLGAMEELPLDDLRAAMEVNVFGVLRVYQAVAPAMRERRVGQVINISSSIGAAALPMYGGYCATKFAVEAMSEAMWYELAPFGVAVNVVRPGLVATPFAAKKASQRSARVQPDSPYADRVDTPSPPTLLGKISTPEQVAEVLEQIIENPGLRFRWVCGEDSNGWIEARRTMDDKTFYRVVTENGYGSV